MFKKRSEKELEESSSGRSYRPEPGVLVGIFGALLAGAAMVGVFVVDGHDAAISTAIVIGSGLVLAGAVLPYLSGEFEVGVQGLRATIGDLNRQVRHAESRVLSGAASTGSGAVGDAAGDPDVGSVGGSDGPSVGGNADVDELLVRAAEDPLRAMLEVAVQIEVELSNIVAPFNPMGSRNRGMAQLAAAARGVLASDLRESIQTFSRLRNEVVHGQVDVAERVMLSAVESGERIVRLLRGVPREPVTVLVTDIEFFADPECTERLSDETLQLVVLGLPPVDTTSGWGRSKPDAVPASSIAVPTRARYQSGEKLRWEWSKEQVGTPRVGWYRDPESGDAVQTVTGWLFAGRRFV